MAEEVEMTPVAAEPPKADPLAKPAVPKASTLKLNPVVRKPAPGAALRPGLKLPPKPGATVSALKPGLKLPPKPGATVSALKPGIKLPPKPVIHKLGSTIAAAPLPKPVTPIASSSAPVAAAESAAPVTEAPKSVAETPKPLEQLKSVTQKLKGITQQIPQQAILRKTGIIADAAMTEAQKEAAKHKTARISLSDAMGVAPVKEEHAPMKTIRIKRPADIADTASLKPQPLGTAASVVEPTAGPAVSAASANASVTQRKTLRITRPGGAVHPAGKFGIKRPSAAASPAEDAPKPEDATELAAADIADIPEMPMPTPVTVMTDGTPSWIWTLSALVQLAACVVIGALAWSLYDNTTIRFF